MTEPDDTNGSVHYRSLFLTLPDPAWVYDAETLAFLDVNDAAVAEYGYTREEFLAMTLRDIRPPEDVDRLAASVRANRPGLMHSGLFRHRTKGGVILHVGITSHDLRYRGRAARIVVARDVTEQVRAQEALIESEERYRDLFENASDIIFTIDLEGRFLSMNRAAEVAGGVAREQAIGRAAFGTMGPSFVERAREAVDRAPAGDADRTSYELEMVRPDGRKVVLEVTSRLIVSRGRPVGVQGIARDITERKRLEAELVQAQKMEGIGRLAGGIAHDFNNLLTAIIGQAELARLALDDGEQPHREIEQIVESSQRAAALTRQLLAFARQEVSQPRAVRINDLVGEVDRLLRRLIGEDVALVTVPAEDLDTVCVDPGQLEQVLINLAVNARDAMPRGGRLTIETANVYLDEYYARQRPDVKPGPHVMISVSDTGVGMAPEVMAHAFEPFFTTKELGKGTGLGLSICYGIVKQNGGHIAVYSEEGKGAAFRIYLPRAGEAAGRAAAQESERATLPRGTETVLIAEDEPRVRDLGARTLRKAGYTVIEAASGPEALEQERAYLGAIHLLITDLVMPRMGGAELAAEVRSRRPATKVLFVSGYSERGAPSEYALEAGSAFLPKPFSAVELARQVRAVLDDAGAGGA